LSFCILPFLHQLDISRLAGSRFAGLDKGIFPACILAILPDAFVFAGTQSNSSFQLEQSQEVAKTTGPAIAGSRDCGNACSTL
jgi:hypothetical protein